MFKYFPHTPSDIQAMLQKVGVGSLDDLYAEVPEQIRFRGDYQLPEEMSELEAAAGRPPVGEQQVLDLLEELSGEGFCRSEDGCWSA